MIKKQNNNFMAKTKTEAEKVSVKDSNGALIRHYSLKVHGETFRDLANEFAGKEEGRVVEDAE